MRVHSGLASRELTLIYPSPIGEGVRREAHDGWGFYSDDIGFPLRLLRNQLPLQGEEKRGPLTALYSAQERVS